MVRKDNPNVPYSISNFPKVVPDVKLFSTEPVTTEIKAFVGWDGIMIFDSNLDILETLKIYAKQYQNYAQSCGRCTPGKYGGRVLYELLNKIQNDCNASIEDIDKLREVCELMTFTSKCEVGKTTPKPILQILESNPEVFHNALQKHKDKTLRDNDPSFMQTTLYKVDYKVNRDIYIESNSELDSATSNTFETLERYKSAIKTTINNTSYISKITAPCTDECPSRVDIPAYIEGVKDMRYLNSLSSTRSNMPLAQVCGRVCPHPCENACRRALLDDPISIMELKRVGADVEFELKRNSKLPNYANPNNMQQDSSYKDIKSVCVIGAGPAGLSSAYYLALRGIQVDVYEALPVLGGEVAVGVPNYRMPIVEYNHDIESLRDLGVRFHVNYEVTKDNIKELEKKHSAIVIAVGTRVSKRLGCKNENIHLEGYVPAIKFMDSVNLAQKFHIGELPNLQGKRVVCVGGGFTSMDVVRCCVRLGASSVIMLYRRDEATIIKNTSKEEYDEACEEGVVFQFLSAVDEILENDGKLRALKINRYELVQSADNPKGELKLVSCNEILECDMLISAVSQEMDFMLDSDFGVEITKWKTIAVDPASYSTNRKGVFAAGDCVSGPLTIVNAVGHGRRVASVVANYIKSGKVEINDDERMEDILKQIGVFDSNRDVHGFLSGNKREISNKLSPSYRNKNFDEVNFGLSRQDALHEASRCMRCYYISMCVIGHVAGRI